MSSRHAFLLIIYAVSATATGWNSALEASLIYCDNLFYLSPADIDSFLRSKNPSRLPYRSLDDLALTAGWSAVWRFSEAGRIRTKVRTHSYMMNWEKSYSVTKLEFEHRLFRTATAGLAAVWMPNRLIRHYRRLDQGRKGDYAECRFSEYLLMGEIRNQYGRFRIQPSYGFAIDDYLPQFEPYDSRIHRLGLELGWSPAENITMVVDYSFRLSLADGPVPDISYRQHGLQIRANASLPWLSGLQPEAEYHHEWRTYTTGNSPEVDPSHAGRQDATRGLVLGFSYRLGRATLTAGYESEWREVYSPYSVVIDEIKDYHVNTGKLGITLQLGRTRQR